MFVDYTAQFAKRARCLYTNFFCSQYIKTVVSPIFVDNKKKKKERKIIPGTIKLSKGRVNEKKN